MCVCTDFCNSVIIMQYYVSSLQTRWWWWAHIQTQLSYVTRSPVLSRLVVYLMILLCPSNYCPHTPDLQLIRLAHCTRAFKALSGRIRADVLLRNYSLTCLGICHCVCVCVCVCVFSFVRLFVQNRPVRFLSQLTVITSKHVFMPSSPTVGIMFYVRPSVIC